MAIQSFAARQGLSAAGGQQNKSAQFDLEDPEVRKQVMAQLGIEEPKPQVDLFSRGLGLLDAFRVTDDINYAMESGDILGAIGGALTDPFKKIGTAVTGRDFDTEDDKKGGAEILEKMKIKNGILKGAGGFVLDVLLDPMTYVSVGTGAGTKIVTKAGAQTLNKTGQKLFAKGVKEFTEELTKAGAKETAELLAREGLEHVANKSIPEIAEALSLNRVKSFADEGVKVLKKLGLEETDELAKQILKDGIIDQGGFKFAGKKLFDLDEGSKAFTALKAYVDPLSSASEGLGKVSGKIRQAGQFGKQYGETLDAAKKGLGEFASGAVSTIRNLFDTTYNQAGGNIDRFGNLIAAKKAADDYLVGQTEDVVRKFKGEYKDILNAFENPETLPFILENTPTDKLRNLPAEISEPLFGALKEVRPEGEVLSAAKAALKPNLEAVKDIVDPSSASFVDQAAKAGTYDRFLRDISAPENFKDILEAPTLGVGGNSKKPFNNAMNHLTESIDDLNNPAQRQQLQDFINRTAIAAEGGVADAGEVVAAAKSIYGIEPQVKIPTPEEFTNIKRQINRIDPAKPNLEEFGQFKDIIDRDGVKRPVFDPVFSETQVRKLNEKGYDTLEDLVKKADSKEFKKSRLVEMPATRTTTTPQLNRLTAGKLPEIKAISGRLDELTKSMEYTTAKAEYQRILGQAKKAGYNNAEEFIDDFIGGEAFRFDADAARNLAMEEPTVKGISKQMDDLLSVNEDIVDSYMRLEQEAADKGFKSVEDYINNKGALPPTSFEEYAKQFRQANLEGAIQHRPTQSGALASDITKNGEFIPEDFYTEPHYYANMDDPASKESFAALKKIKGKPDAEVTIYRASPRNELRNGDWVSLSKEYAGRESTTEGTAVNSFKVKAKDIHFAGDDINEFGFYPSDETLKKMYSESVGKPAGYKNADEYIDDLYKQGHFDAFKTPTEKYQEEMRLTKLFDEGGVPKPEAPEMKIVNQYRALSDEIERLGAEQEKKIGELVVDPKKYYDEEISKINKWKDMQDRAYQLEYERTAKIDDLINQSKVSQEVKTTAPMREMSEYQQLAEDLGMTSAELDKAISSARKSLKEAQEKAGKVEVLLNDVYEVADPLQREIIDKQLARIADNTQTMLDVGAIESSSKANYIGREYTLTPGGKDLTEKGGILGMFGGGSMKSSLDPKSVTNQKARIYEYLADSVAAGGETTITKKGLTKQEIAANLAEQFAKDEIKAISAKEFKGLADQVLNGQILDAQGNKLYKTAQDVVDDLIGNEINVPKKVIDAVENYKATGKMSQSMKEYFKGKGYMQLTQKGGGVIPAFKDAFFDPEAHQVLTNMHKAFFGDEDFNRIVKLYDKVQNTLKASQTAWFPAFHVRNAFSNVFSNAVAGLKDPRKYKDAIGLQQYGNLLEKFADAADDKAVAAAKEALEKAGNKTIDLGERGVMRVSELYDLAKNNGVISGGYYGDLAEDIMGKKISPVSSINPLSRDFVLSQVGTKVGGAVEDNGRLALFIDGLSKNMDTRSAALRVKEVLFDYGDLTDFEKNIMKRLVPYYTWTKKNAVLQMQRIIKQPGHYAAMISGFEDLRDAMSDLSEEEKAKLPEWAKQGVGLMFKTDGDNVSAITQFGLPHEAFQKLLADNPLNQLGVPPKVAIELGTGQNIFKGKAILDDTDGKAFKNYPQYIKDRMGYREEKRKNRNGEEYTVYYVDPWAKYWVGTLLGRTQSTVTKASSIGEEGDAPADLLNLFTGIKKYDFNLTEEGEKRNREQSKKLYQMLVDRGLAREFTSQSLTQESKDLLASIGQ